MEAHMVRFGTFTGLAALALFTSACSDFGKVNQGRVIAYDRANGLITLISDSNFREPGKPRFDVLPPVTIQVPANPAEMGPAPEAGRLVQLDSANRRFMVFHEGVLKSIPYTPVEEHANIPPDSGRLAGMTFPIVDKENRTVTTYCALEKKLLTARVSGEYLALPPESWKAGDEVRYYYKQPDQALRLMNVTKTDINKGGK
jgi:hypothetical protein